MNKKYLLIRSLAGTGGDTLCTLLERKMGFPTAWNFYGPNRAGFNDMFNNAFGIAHPRKLHILQHGVPDMKWRDMSPAVLREFVETRMKWTDRRIGRCHYIFQKDYDWRIPFREFLLIDLTPNPDKQWISMVMAAHKVAFLPEYEEPNKWTDCIDVTNSRKHWDQHGWYPRYYHFAARYDGLTPQQFIEYTLQEWNAWINLLRRSPTFSKYQDWWIDGGTLTVDRNLTGFKIALQLLDLPDLTDDDVQILGNWVEQNCRLLEDCGLGSYIDADTTEEQGIQLQRQGMELAVARMLELYGIAA
jgi:hypothetical protein